MEAKPGIVEGKPQFVGVGGEDDDAPKKIRDPKLAARQPTTFDIPSAILESVQSIKQPPEPPPKPSKTQRKKSASKSMPESASTAQQQPHTGDAESKHVPDVPLQNAERDKQDKKDDKKQDKEDKKQDKEDKNIVVPGKQEDMKPTNEEEKGVELKAADNKSKDDKNFKKEDNKPPKVESKPSEKMKKTDAPDNKVDEKNHKNGELSKVQDDVALKKDEPDKKLDDVVKKLDDVKKSVEAVKKGADENDIKKEEPPKKHDETPKRDAELGKKLEGDKNDDVDAKHDKAPGNPPWFKYLQDMLSAVPLKAPQISQDKDNAAALSADNRGKSSHGTGHEKQDDKPAYHNVSNIPKNQITETNLQRKSSKTNEVGKSHSIEHEKLLTDDYAKEKYSFEVSPSPSRSGNEDYNYMRQQVVFLPPNNSQSSKTSEEIVPHEERIIDVKHPEPFNPMYDTGEFDEGPSDSYTGYDDLSSYMYMSAPLDPMASMATSFHEILEEFDSVKDDVSEKRSTCRKRCNSTCRKRCKCDNSSSESDSRKKNRRGSKNRSKSPSQDLMFDMKIKNRVSDEKSDKIKEKPALNEAFVNVDWNREASEASNLFDSLWNDRFFAAKPNNLEADDDNANKQSRQRQSDRKRTTRYKKCKRDDYVHCYPRTKRRYLPHEYSRYHFRSEYARPNYYLNPAWYYSPLAPQRANVAAYAMQTGGWQNNPFRPRPMPVRYPPLPATYYRQPRQHPMFNEPRQRNPYLEKAFIDNYTGTNYNHQYNNRLPSNSIRNQQSTKPFIQPEYMDECFSETSLNDNVIDPGQNKVTPKLSVRFAPDNNLENIAKIEQEVKWKPKASRNEENECKLKHCGGDCNNENKSNNKDAFYTDSATTNFANPIQQNIRLPFAIPLIALPPQTLNQQWLGSPTLRSDDNDSDADNRMSRRSSRSKRSNKCGGISRFFTAFGSEESDDEIVASSMIGMKKSSPSCANNRCCRCDAARFMCACSMQQLPTTTPSIQVIVPPDEAYTKAKTASGIQSPPVIYKLTDRWAQTEQQDTNAKVKPPALKQNNNIKENNESKKLEFQNLKNENKNEGKIEKIVYKDVSVEALPEVNISVHSTPSEITETISVMRSKQRKKKKQSPSPRKSKVKNARYSSSDEKDTEPVNISLSRNTDSSTKQNTSKISIQRSLSVTAVPSQIILQPLVYQFPDAYQNMDPYYGYANDYSEFYQPSVAHRITYYNFNKIGSATSFETAPQSFPAAIEHSSMSRSSARSLGSEGDTLSKIAADNSNFEKSETKSLSDVFDASKSSNVEQSHKSAMTPKKEHSVSIAPVGKETEKKSSLSICLDVPTALQSSQQPTAATQKFTDTQHKQMPTVKQSPTKITENVAESIVNDENKNNGVKDKPKSKNKKEDKKLDKKSKPKKEEKKSDKNQKPDKKKSDKKADKKKPEKSSKKPEAGDKESPNQKNKNASPDKPDKKSDTKNSNNGQNNNKIDSKDKKEDKKSNKKDKGNKENKGEKKETKKKEKKKNEKKGKTDKKSEGDKTKEKDKRETDKAKEKNAKETDKSKIDKTDKEQDKKDGALETLKETEKEKGVSKDNKNAFNLSIKNVENTKEQGKKDGLSKPLTSQSEIKSKSEPFENESSGESGLLKLKPATKKSSGNLLTKLRKKFPEVNSEFDSSPKGFPNVNDIPAALPRSNFSLTKNPSTDISPFGTPNFAVNTLDKKNLGSDIKETSEKITTKSISLETSKKKTAKEMCFAVKDCKTGEKKLEMAISADTNINKNIEIHKNILPDPFALFQHANRSTPVKQVKSAPKIEQKVTVKKQPSKSPPKKPPKAESVDNLNITLVTCEPFNVPSQVVGFRAPSSQWDQQCPTACSSPAVYIDMPTDGCGCNEKRPSLITAGVLTKNEAELYAGVSLAVAICMLLVVVVVRVRHFYFSDHVD